MTSQKFSSLHTLTSTIAEGTLKVDGNDVHKPRSRLSSIKQYLRVNWKKKEKQCNLSSKSINCASKEASLVNESSLHCEQSLQFMNSYTLFEGLKANQFEELCLQPWFWGPITRFEATQLLMMSPPGSFIVRDSEKDTSRFTLTFKCSNGQILNNRIAEQSNVYAFLEGEAFGSIRELIENAMTYSKKGAYCLSRPAGANSIAGSATLTTNVVENEDDGGSTVAARSPQTTDLPSMIPSNSLDLSIDHSKYSLKAKREKAHDDGIWCCAWQKRESDGKEVVITGCLDSSLKLWTWTGDDIQFKANCEGHRLGVVSVDINADASMAVSSSLDSQVIFWDLDSGKQKKVYEATPVDTWTVAFSPDSRFVATGSHAGCINLIGVESGRKENVIELDGKFIYCLDFSADGQRLAAGSVSGVVSICDLQTGSIYPLDGHAKHIRSVAFSPDGRLLASTSDDRQIRIFDAHNGRLIISSLNGHSGWVVSSMFSPDSRHLVTASTDKTVRVWDISSKTELCTFREHVDQVWCARYNSQGSQIMSVGDDRSIIVYNSAK